MNRLLLLVFMAFSLSSSYSQSASSQASQVISIHLLPVSVIDISPQNISSQSIQSESSMSLLSSHQPVQKSGAPFRAMKKELKIKRDYKTLAPKGDGEKEQTDTFVYTYTSQ